MNLTKIDGNSFGTDYAIGFFPGAEPVLPALAAKFAKRSGAWPLIPALDRQGVRFNLLARITGSGVETLRQQLYRWFDPENETPIKLTGEVASVERYRYVICESIKPLYPQPDPPQAYIIGLATHGDPRWREETAATDSWSITATGQTKAVTNNGKDVAYPILKIKPTSSKMGGYSYKSFITVRWRASDAANSYPVDICNDSFDTATLVGAGKMQADGDDLRVLVDGVEIDRWLDGINTGTTKVWCNLDFQAAQEATLEAGIGSGDTVETIDVNEDISGFSDSGILLINSELFTYTGKNNSLRRFTGVTRAAKGTSAGTHAADDDVIWIQHDIWILYGNSTAAAPTVDDNYKPAFALASSTNVSWDYDDFGEDDGKRAAAWASESILGSPDLYTDNRGASADPWAEIGIHCPGTGTAIHGLWKLHNPCGLTNANFQNGEKWSETVALFSARIVSSLNGSTWTEEYLIPDPSSPSTWESWSRNEVLTSGSKYVALRIYTYVYDNEFYVEAADVTLTLDNIQTPAITIGVEQGNYSLSCTITNTTTGDAIELDHIMELNEELEVDTDEKTVIYLADNMSQFQTLTLTGGARRDWLPLDPGSNTLQFDDTGTGNVTIALEWQERWY